MSGPEQPEPLAQALRERNAVVERSWDEPPRAYLHASAGDAALFARWSADPADEPVYRHEASIRAAVGERGALRSPRVLASGPLWLLERGVRARSFEGAAAVDAAVAAAAALLEREDLEPAPASPSPRRDRRAALRRLSMLRTGIPLRDLWLARGAVADSSLPEAVSHGDFHVRNLLIDAEGLWVIDWELLDRRPLGYDLMSLWASLERPEDRDRVFRAALELAGAGHAEDVARLRHAVVVRVILGKLAPAADYNADRAGAQRLLGLLPGIRP